MNLRLTEREVRDLLDIVSMFAENVETDAIPVDEGGTEAEWESYETARRLTDELAARVARLADEEWEARSADERGES